MPCSPLRQDGTCPTCTPRPSVTTASFVINGEALDNAMYPELMIESGIKTLVKELTGRTPMTNGHQDLTLVGTFGGSPKLEVLYTLVQDESSHWYVIPAYREEEFATLAKDEDIDEFPEWAVPVGGSPSLVRFTGFTLVP